MAKGKNIVFMGTPEFAALHLRSIIQAGFPVVGVVTQPDRPRGRGRKLEPTPVKSVAKSYGIPLIQPENLEGGSRSIEWLRAMGPDLLVVVAFGMILPKPVLEIAQGGGWNVHASLLPKYRGAAPIQWAIIKGEKKTGITLMQMDEGMDTGDILLQEELDIGPDETAGHLHDRLSQLGVKVLLEGLRARDEDRIETRPQNHDGATYTSLIKKEHRPVDWSDSAENIRNKIRGLNPRPGAKSGQLKLLGARALNEKTDRPPGVVTQITPEGIKIAAGDGVLLLTEVQPPGGRAMPAADYAQGHKVTPGVKLNNDK